MNFQQAILPHFVLGQKPEAVPIDREGILDSNQKHDVEVIFECGEVGSSGSFTLLASTEATVIPEIDRKANEVNPATCEWIRPEDKPAKPMIQNWGQL
jgi:hypothetical protein